MWHLIFHLNEATDTSQTVLLKSLSLLHHGCALENQNSKFRD